ncbi:hypothetical protein K9M79_07945 [Candidatus Woesearchaeota archaeon]|nr:hypothetical protein [Candidatus Woesearchaeota archaeon]
MNRSLEVIIGMFLSAIFIVFLFSFSNRFANEPVTKSINDLSKYIDGDTLIVTWTTDEPTNGQIDYNDGTNSYYTRDYQFSNTHRVEVNLTGLSGIIYYKITTCDLAGTCLNSPELNVTV